MIQERVKKILKKRDPYCIHCGEDSDLVIHHRKHRGMGGSKLLDHYQNLLMVCATYNSDMESQPLVADDSRRWGHKLESWAEFSEPVLDRCNGLWYQLEQDGTKTVVAGREESLI
jgi:5-methylcytosine-specific restriction endonuclease McrA